jgi:hypothetical protein
MEETGYSEIILFIVELVMAAALISIIVMFSRTTTLLASGENDEQIIVEKTVLGRKYLPYDGQTITGGEVIALLRENAVNEGSLTITVDKNRNNMSMIQSSTNYADAGWGNRQLAIAIDAGAKYESTLVFYGEEDPAYAALVQSGAIQPDYSEVSGVTLKRK